MQLDHFCREDAHTPASAQTVGTGAGYSRDAAQTQKRTGAAPQSEWPPVWWRRRVLPMAQGPTTRTVQQRGGLMLPSSRGAHL